MSDAPYIRSSTLDAASRGGPVDVCEHVSLPSAFPSPKHTGEYTVPLSIHCDECDETYAFRVAVN